MGGLCQSNQSTNYNQVSSFTPPPAVTGAGTQALQTAQNLGTTPFSIPVQPVAGFTPQQEQAFNEVQGLQDTVQPFYREAAAFEQPGNNPFFAPEAAGVTNELNNLYGQQFASDTGNWTQAAGGVGADRIAVAQGILANQQALAEGSTLANIYGQSEGQAQQAGLNLGQLATGELAGELKQAEAEMGAGTTQQQQEQNILNAFQQNILQRIAWPYQTNQYLASIEGAVAPTLGGTNVTSGAGTTTTTPSYLQDLQTLGGSGGASAGIQGMSNMLGTLGQGVGAGIGALGSFFVNRGGRVTPFHVDPKVFEEVARALGGRTNREKFAIGGGVGGKGAGIANPLAPMAPSAGAAGMGSMSKGFGLPIPQPQSLTPGLAGGTSNGASGASAAEGGAIEGHTWGGSAGFAGGGNPMAAPGVPQADAQHPGGNTEPAGLQAILAKLMQERDQLAQPLMQKHGFAHHANMGPTPFQPGVNPGGFAHGGRATPFHFAEGGTPGLSDNEAVVNLFQSGIPALTGGIGAAPLQPGRNPAMTGAPDPQHMLAMFAPHQQPQQNATQQQQQNTQAVPTADQPGSSGPPSPLQSVGHDDVTSSVNTPGLTDQEFGVAGSAFGGSVHPAMPFHVKHFQGGGATDPFGGTSPWVDPTMSTENFDPMGGGYAPPPPSYESPQVDTASQQAVEMAGQVKPYLAGVGQRASQFLPSFGGAQASPSPVATPPATPLNPPPAPPSVPTVAAPLPGLGVTVTPPATPLVAPPGPATPPSTPTQPTAPTRGDAIDASSKEASTAPFDPRSDRSIMDMISIRENGHPMGTPAALGSISPDAHHSKSYGAFGLNSFTGSAEAFAQEYGRALGLTARPGTPEFDQQWRQAAYNNPQGMYAAQADWYAKNVLPQATAGLRAYGVDPRLAQDPRVAAYFADRYVQMGTVGLQNALAAARGAQSPQEFLARVSAADKQNIPQNFRTYLAENPNNMRGLVNRIDSRMAGNVGAGAVGQGNIQLAGQRTPGGGGAGAPPPTPVGSAGAPGAGAPATPFTTPAAGQGISQNIGQGLQGLGAAISRGSRGLGDMLGDIGAGFGGPEAQMARLRYQMYRDMAPQMLSDTIRGNGKAAVPPEQPAGGGAAPGAGSTMTPAADALGQSYGYRNAREAITGLGQQIQANERRVFQAGFLGLPTQSLMAEQAQLRQKQDALARELTTETQARTAPQTTTSPSGQETVISPASGQLANPTGPGAVGPGGGARVPIMGTSPSPGSTPAGAPGPATAGAPGAQPRKDWQDDPGGYTPTAPGTIVKKLAPEVAPGREKLLARDNAASGALTTNQDVGNRLRDMKKIVAEIKPGIWAGSRRRIGEMASELGLQDFLPTNWQAQGYEEFMKQFYSNIISSVKQANEGTGSKILATEIDKAQHAGADVFKTDKAINHMLDYQLGTIDWTNKYLNDYHNWYTEHQSTAHNAGGFDNKWNADPDNRQDVFTNAREQNKPPPPNSRQIGFSFTNSSGETRRWDGRQWVK